MTTACAHARLVAAAHYIIARTDPANLGAVKLNKVLWYADVESYRRTGETITGLRCYVRRPNGPVPPGMKSAIDSLKADGQISERLTQVIDHHRREFVWLKDPDISLFSAEQIDLLNVFISLIQQHTADVVSKTTHDALWDELEDGESMLVSAASVIPVAPSPKQLEWANSI